MLSKGVNSELAVVLMLSSLWFTRLYRVSSRQYLVPACGPSTKVAFLWQWERRGAVMTSNLPLLGVSHVQRANTDRTPHVLRPRQHVIHVAFNNQVDASEKWINGKRVPKHPGRLVGRSLLLPTGHELLGWTVGKVDFLRLEVHPDALRTASEAAGQGRVPELRLRVQLDDPVLWHLACVLRADLAMGCPGGQILRDGVQVLISHHLATVGLQAPQRQNAGPGPLNARQLRAAQEYVRENLHVELRLAEIAGVAGLSTFHFARGFKTAVGMSPYQYVLEERLTTARKLLEATDLGIGEITGLTGFQSVTGFGAAFRRRWGTSPSAYRKSVRA